MLTLYKVLHPDGRVYHNGKGSWPLPSGDKPGEWVEIAGRIIPCSQGLHLCRKQDLLNWLGPAIFEAEHEGPLVVHADGSGSSKVVARKARLIRRVETWDDRTARLFAADCAERALPVFERVYRNDPRPRRAVEATRAYARGEIDAQALEAAGDDAWAAVEVAWASRAAFPAAETVAWVAGTAAAANVAAWTVVHIAARTAAGAIARAAGEADAWDAERAWQTERLMQYLRGEA